MDPKEHNRLARALAGKPGLSRPEKEDVLAAVLAETAPRRAWLRWTAGAGALAACGAAALVLVLGRPGGGLTPRGAEAPPSSVRAFCPSEPTGASCRRGEALLFEVLRAPPHPHLAAFVRREDGVVLWYFPDHADGTSLDLARHASAGAIDRKVLLGEDHPAGSYDLTLLFSPTPLGRDEIKRRLTGAAPAGTIVEQHQRLVVR